MYKTHAINELSFPKTAHEIQARRTPDHVVYGGAARSALLEAQSTSLNQFATSTKSPSIRLMANRSLQRLGIFPSIKRLFWAMVSSRST